MKIHSPWLLFIALLSIVFSPVILAAPSTILIQSGQKIGFLGDSITQQGNAPTGYIMLVIAGLKSEGIDATAIPAGMSGHTSGNMNNRVDHDVLSQGADWMTVSCGVNDIALQKKGFGVDLENYKKNVTSILDQANAKKVKVVLLTATPIGEDPNSPENQMQIGYNQFLRDTAKERNLPLADVNAAFWEVIKAHPGPIGLPAQYIQGRLLADGIHPNVDGQRIMAETVLLTLGVPKDDLPKLEETWPKTREPRHKSVAAPTPETTNTTVTPATPSSTPNP